jgi:hypothetical protein
LSATGFNASLLAMLYLPINREWLFSSTAQRVYLCCALLTIALLATLLATHVAISVAGVSELNSEARLLLRRFLFPQILGAALLWVSMWYFWFGFDSSPYVRKAASFVLLFFLAPIGTLVYYFLTYRRLVRTGAQSSGAAANPR